MSPLTPAPPGPVAPPLSRVRLAAGLVLAAALLAVGIVGALSPGGRAAAAAPVAAVTLAARPVTGLAARPVTLAARPASRPAAVPPVNCDATPWLCGIVSSTWQRVVDPTYSGPGTNPIVESACAPGRCGFLTGGGGRANGGFVVALPAGFVQKIQGGSAGEYNNMAVIRAMLRLPPIGGNVTEVMPSFTVAPGYAAKLRAAGISPSVFLAWMISGLPAAQVRQNWHCGIFGCHGAGFDSGNYTALPAGERGGLTRRVPLAVATVTHSVTATVGRVAHTVAHAAAGAVAAVTRVVGDGPPKAGGGGRGAGRRGSPTGSAGSDSRAEVRSAAKGNPAAAAALPLVHGRPATVGDVIPHAPGCPAGQALLVAPTGPRCLPDIAVGIHPGWPWWEWVAAILGGLVALWVVAYIWVRHRDAVAASAEE